MPSRVEVIGSSVNRHFVGPSGSARGRYPARTWG
jgi:hypothetical protein